MSKERYGIRRFALLNTAGYSPLWKSRYRYTAPTTWVNPPRSTPCSSRSWRACRT